MFALPEPRSQRSVVEEDEIPSGLKKPAISRLIGFSRNSSSQTRGSLLTVAKQLRECAESRKDFLCAADEWKVHREASIAFLDDAIERLNAVHYKTNCAKLAGSAGAVICGCFGLASAVQMASGMDATAMRDVADFGNVLSAGVSNSAAAIELGLIQTYMNKAKRILEKDSERVEPLREWFELTDDLKRSIEDLSNCNVLSDVMQKLVVVVPTVIGTYKSLSSQIDRVVDEVVKVLDKNTTRNDVEKIIFLCASVCSNPELLKIVGNIHQMIRSTPTIMPVVASLVKIPCTLETVQHYIRGTSGKKVSKQEAITYGIFQAVNVGIELFSMKLLVEDFQQGSVSEHATIFKELKEQLQMELKLISKIQLRLESN